jgi:hypothetical protein
MHGFVPLSLSLHYFLSHAPKQTKLSSQPNSSVVMLAFGGTTIMPCNRMDMLSHGKSSRPPLGCTISWKDSLSGSNEFLALTQGNRTVLQYAQAFNHLCQYAGYHANTDAKKRDQFCRGLNTKLKERLNLVRADNFNELVNIAITQEDCISAHRGEKRQKVSTGPSNAQPSRYRVIQNPVPRASPRNVPNRQMGS